MDYQRKTKVNANSILEQAKGMDASQLGREVKRPEGGDSKKPDAVYKCWRLGKFIFSFRWR